MRVSTCEYCDGLAAHNFGEMWLCEPHGVALQDYVGGLEPLLELAPQARRAVAEAILPRLVRHSMEPMPFPQTFSD